MDVSETGNPTLDLSSDSHAKAASEGVPRNEGHYDFLALPAECKHVTCHVCCSIWLSRECFVQANKGCCSVATLRG